MDEKPYEVSWEVASLIYHTIRHIPQSGDGIREVQRLVGELISGLEEPPTPAPSVTEEIILDAAKCSNFMQAVKMKYWERLLADAKRIPNKIKEQEIDDILLLAWDVLHPKPTPAPAELVDKARLSGRIAAILGGVITRETHKGSAGRVVVQTTEAIMDVLDFEQPTPAPSEKDFAPKW